MSYYTDLKKIIENLDNFSNSEINYIANVITNFARKHKAGEGMIFNFKISTKDDLDLSFTQLQLRSKAKLNSGKMVYFGFNGID